MLKGIIFDMDGVLINSEPVHYRVWKEALRRRNVDIDFETYKPCIGSTIGFLMNLLHEHYGVDKNDKSLPLEMKAIKKEIVEQEGFPIIDGVPELLARLKQYGLKLAIASSSPLDYIRQVVNELKIGQYFEVLVSGESVKNPKPAPDVFLKAVDALGFSKDECLIVEDSTNGCRAAKAAGVTCMAYFNPDSGDQDLSTAAMVVEGYEEIDGDFVEKVYCHAHHLPYTVCKTKRLLIKEMIIEEIPRLMEIAAQDTSADATEGAAKPLEQELDNFESYRTYMYEMCDMGFWSIVLKDTGEIIGRAGIEPKVWNKTKTVVEMGYMIDENYRRQGYAYEACQGIIKEAEKRGAVYLYCRILASNEPSKKLAEKLGFTRLNYHVDGDQEDMEVWRYSFKENISADKH